MMAMRFRTYDEQVGRKDTRDSTTKATDALIDAAGLWLAMGKTREEFLTEAILTWDRLASTPVTSTSR